MENKGLKDGGLLWLELEYLTHTVTRKIPSLPTIPTRSKTESVESFSARYPSTPTSLPSGVPTLLAYILLC